MVELNLASGSEGVLKHSLKLIKDIEEVVSQCKIAKKVAKLKPLAVIKG